MGDNSWVALEEEDGKTYLVELIDKMHKVKGIGAQPVKMLNELEIGDSIQLGHKSFKRLQIDFQNSANLWLEGLKLSVLKMQE